MTKKKSTDTSKKALKKAKRKKPMNLWDLIKFLRKKGKKRDKKLITISK